MAHMPRYQLLDNPVSQTAQQQPQSQANNDGYRPGPSQPGSGDNGYAAQPSSPKPLFSATAPLNAKRGQSPTQVFSTVVIGSNLLSSTIECVYFINDIRALQE